MTHRSSTSSSDRADGGSAEARASTRPRGRWIALVVALGLLVTFDVLVARNDRLWSYLPRSDTGVLLAMEERFTASSVDPVVVALGNSRVRDAVSPRPLEAQLGLRPGQVLNLGITQGSLYDSLLIYRRNRARLRHARVLVVGVEDWYFNANRSPGDRDRRFRSLAERLGGFGVRDTIDLVVGWAWRAFAARNVLRRVVEHVGEVPRPIVFTADGRIDWREDHPEVGPEVVDVEQEVRDRYEEYEFDPSSLAHLRALVSLAREDDTQVIFLRPPCRAQHVQRVDREFRAERELSERTFSEFAEREAAPALLLRAGTELGIPERFFHDYGHLVTPGAEIVTRILGEFLTETAGEALEAR